MEDQLAKLTKLILEHQSPSEDVTVLKSQLKEKESVILSLTDLSESQRNTIGLQQLEIKFLKEKENELSKEVVELRVKLSQFSNCVDEQKETIKQYNDELSEAKRLITDQKDSLNTLTRRIQEESRSTRTYFDELFAETVKSLRNENETQKMSLTADVNSCKKLNKESLVEMEKDLKTLREEIKTTLGELSHKNQVESRGLKHEIQTFQRNATLTLSKHSNESRDIAVKALQRAKNELQKEYENELIELKEDLKSDVGDMLDEVKMDITKLDSAIQDVEKRQSNIKKTDLHKELGKWYHALQNVWGKGVSTQGTLVHKSITEGIDVNKFGILLEHLDSRVLDWKNKSHGKMNALELAWSVEANELAEIIAFRKNDDYILGKWKTSVKSAMKSHLPEKARLLLKARTEAIPQRYKSISSILGKEVLESAERYVCFDPNANSMKSLSNNNMVISSGYGDNKKRGTLLNLGVSSGVAKWSFVLESNLHVAVGICYKNPCFNWDMQSSHIIALNCRTLMLSGTDIDKQKPIRRTARCDVKVKEEVFMILDMKKRELSIKLGDNGSQILARNLVGKWWPYFGIVDLKDKEVTSISLKSFSAVEMF